MVGKLHKKKISEYAEAAENEEKQQNDEKTDEGEETIEDKDDEQVSGSESDTGDGANNENNKSRDSMTNNEETAGDETGDNEDEDKLPDSNEAEDSEPENGKKGKKRKALERAPRKDGATEEDSDDEPLNGTVSPKKKGKKSAGISGGGSKGKKNMKSGGKGKQSKKSAPKVDEEEEEEEAEYEVKDIVGHKMERGISYFLIRWKGYTKDDDTWEPEDTLNCPEIIDKYKKKQAINSPKKGGTPIKKGKGNAKNISIKPKEDPNKEWEVEKIIDYAEEKTGRVFRIRWKGFGPKHDTWEPEKNLNCNDIIQKFMKRMKSQENVSFKELREEPKKTKRLVNETALRTNLNNPIGRKSKRSSAKKRVFYGDMED